MIERWSFKKSWIMDARRTSKRSFSDLVLLFEEVELVGGEEGASLSIFGVSCSDSMPRSASLVLSAAAARSVLGLFPVFSCICTVSCKFEGLYSVH